MPSPLRVISMRPSVSGVWPLIFGRSSPVRMTITYTQQQLRPSEPPGWDEGEIFLRKTPTFEQGDSQRVTHGQRGRGAGRGGQVQGAGLFRYPCVEHTVAAPASVESSLPVMVIKADVRRLSNGRRVISSPVSPEFERAITTSLRVIMPRSPWLASPGCTKKAGVPVLASVAASFAANVSGFAHAGNHDPSPTCQAFSAGLRECLANARQQCGNRLSFNFQDLARARQDFSFVHCAAQFQSLP